MKAAVTAFIILAVMTAFCTAYAQEGITTGPSTEDVFVNVVSPLSISIDNMKYRTTKFVCGGLAQPSTLMHSAMNQ